jgi:hypothetical protein
VGLSWPCREMHLRSDEAAGNATGWFTNRESPNPRPLPKSWKLAGGARVPLAIIGKSLGHADLESTQICAQPQLDRVRGSVTRSYATSAAGAL